MQRCLGITSVSSLRQPPTLLPTAWWDSRSPTSPHWWPSSRSSRSSCSREKVSQEQLTGQQLQIFLFFHSGMTYGVLSCLVMTAWLCFSSAQVLKAATSSSITCRRSSLTLRYCRCSCHLEMSSLRRSLSTAPPTRVNASVSRFMPSSASVKGLSCESCC